MTAALEKLLGHAPPRSRAHAGEQDRRQDAGAQGRRPRGGREGLAEANARAGLLAVWSLTMPLKPHAGSLAGSRCPRTTSDHLRPGHYAETHGASPESQS